VDLTVVADSLAAWLQALPLDGTNSEESRQLADQLADILQKVDAGDHLDRRTAGRGRDGPVGKRLARPGFRIDKGTMASTVFADQDQSAGASRIGADRLIYRESLCQMISRKGANGRTSCSRAMTPRMVR
jgi:hypothetical protein